MRSDVTQRDLLRIESVRKSFGATAALREASLTLRPGEIHALMGENGSGKSTLVKILSGVHLPDAGSITVAERTHTGFRSPAASIGSGIATVFQEVLVVESQTVLENLWLGTDGLLIPRRGRTEKERLGAALLARLFETPPRLDALLGDLDLSDRQTCSIARAMLREPSVLILDEATSALDFDTRSRLFAVLREWSAQGVAVMLISHRMDEVREIADRVTVLRSGSTVGTIEGRDWTSAEVVKLMTGSDGITTDEVAEELRQRSGGTPVLDARGLRLAPGRAPIDFRLCAGELVGLAGLEGQGQDFFLRSLWGLTDAEGEVVRIGPAGEHRIGSKFAARRADIAYVPRERRAESLFGWMSVLENFVIPTARLDRRFGLLRTSAAAARFRSYASRLRVKFGRETDNIGTLSGGNQQKVIIARWLAAEPAILLLNDPTRGIDIGAKRDLYALLTELTAEGLAVVMLSTEVDEHLELMDRVVVFRDFEIAAEFDRSELDRDALVASFFGGAGAEDSASHEGTTR